MDFGEGKAETDGNERIESIRLKVIRYALVLAGLITGIVICISCKVMAGSYYHYMYDIKMRYYSKDKVTLKFTMEDIKNTCIGNERAGATVYAFDTYLKDRSLPEGQWQLAMDVRKANLVKVTEADFGMSDMPVVEGDITDLYNNTKAFRKRDSSEVECSKTVTDKSVTFNGNGYYNYVILAVVSKGYPTDKEWLYQYLEQTTYNKAGRKVRYTFFEYTLIMRCASSQYRVNDGQWQDWQDISKTFNYSDYRDGDVIWFRAVYDDGSYSAPISHIVAKLNVHVDSAGGIINGHDTMFTCVSDGTYEDNVYIASNNEEIEKFDRIVCEREGYTFKGFEFVDGYGQIIQRHRYGYRMYVQITNIRTGQKATVTEPVNQETADKCGSKEAVRQYYIKDLKRLYGASARFTYKDEDIVIVEQNQMLYYVNSDLPSVTVRAVWEGKDGQTPDTDSRDDKHTLVKISSTRYKESLIKRTDGDDRWYNTSSVLRLSDSMNEHKDDIAVHIKISSSGDIIIK